MSATPLATVEALVDAAMALHADQPRDAAALLSAAAPQLLGQATADALSSLMRGAEHVLIGHLNDLSAWLQWQVLCEADLHRCALWDDEQDRLSVQLALLAGQPAPLQRLAPDQQVRAHYNVALAHTRARRFDAAQQLLAQAQALARPVPQDLKVQGALAALANNLAADLRYYFQAPDPQAAALMLAAAELARAAWALAGGWREVERADWQLAMCAAAAAEGPRARRHALACLAACEQHEADDHEHCFAWQAMAMAGLACADPAGAAQARREMAVRCERLVEPADQSYARLCLAQVDAGLAA
jgi:hypothetical protein